MDYRALQNANSKGGKIAPCKKTGIVLATSLVTVAAICTIIIASRALFAEEFLIFSRFAWGSCSVSFYAVCIACEALAVVSLVNAGLVLHAALFDRIKLRCVSQSPFVVGLVLICLALFTGVSGIRSRPHVFRTVNLICQDLEIWGCGSRAVQQTQSTHPARNQTRLGNVHGSPLKEVLDFESSFNHTFDVQTGTNEVCRQIHALCVPPLGFQAATSCVCSGQWDFSQTAIRDSKPRGPWTGSHGAYCESWEHGGGNSGAAWCFVSQTQQCEFNYTQSSYHNNPGMPAMFRGNGPCTRSVESRSEYMLRAVDLLKWLVPTVGILGILELTLSCIGMALYPRSPQGPIPETAASDVEEAQPEVATATPVAEKRREGGLPKLSASSARQASVSIPIVADSPPEPTLGNPLTLPLRFKEAQREAAKKLKASTPDDIKMRIFGLLRQSKEGDVRGERPDGSRPGERAKYDAWADCKGMSKEHAMEAYAKRVAAM